MIDFSQLDYQISMLEDHLVFLKDLRNKRESLEAIQKAEQLGEHLKFMFSQLHSTSSEGLEVLKHTKITPKPEVAIEADDFLKTRQLLMSEHWPKAVREETIIDINDDAKKLVRATDILNSVIRQRMDGMNVLDFGCGEGHLAYKIALDKNAKFAVGYDLIPQGWDRFEGTNNFLATDSMATVTSHSPYDFIILYDVLDHVVDINPEELLWEIRKLCHNDTKVFIRCQPWTARHGTHTFRKVNRAFSHLIFSDSELTKLGLKPEYPILKLIHPIATYQEWFRKGTFEVIKEEIRKDPVEDFFLVPKLADKIKAHWASSPIEKYKTGEEFPKEIMEVSFVDYFLQKV